MKLQDSTIIEIKNFATIKQSDAIAIIGYSFKTEDFFIKPCQSSVLGIYLLKNKSKTLNFWNLSEVNCKMMVLPFKENTFVAIPILHTIVQ